jgi:tRNA-dihydrouridine synthase C
MKIILAPMEGVIDYGMRELLGHIGGYDMVITEFLRVSNRVFPSRHFYKFCPELRCGGQTTSGMDVRIQIMGQDANLMAENAHKACELGSKGIDINFGCPAKKVNQHRGGVVLLKEPKTVHNIVSSVRRAMPKNQILSVKMRLGIDDPSWAVENALNIQNAGAQTLCVHARTKKDGYRPPAHWHLLYDIQQALDIPVIVNGDIFCKKTAQMAQKASGCTDIMIGRGGLAMPNLGKVIRGEEETVTWARMKEILVLYAAFKREGDHRFYLPSRIKQWFCYLNGVFPEAQELFKTLKRENDIDALIELIKRS